jgi:hypothetical protein
MRDVLGREGGKLLVQVLRDMVNRREVGLLFLSVPEISIHQTKIAPVPQKVDESSEIRPAPMIELGDAHFDPKSFTAEEVYRRWRAIGHQVRFRVLPTGVAHVKPFVAADHNIR